MKAIVVRNAIGAAALVIAGTVCAQQPEQPVAVNTDGLPMHVRRALQEKALQGKSAVIRYINRTRIVYNLYVGDIFGPRAEDDPRTREKQKARRSGA